MTLDLTTEIGSVRLPNPVMTAAGTAGHGDELSAYFDLASLGAIVVKSLSADPWPGNPTPRLRPVTNGMLNSVGLQGPGIASWLETELVALEATGARVVASIWGRTVEDFARAALLLRDAPDCVVAIEVNASCPNLEDRSKIFAHSPATTAEVIEASRGTRPLWAKLSPNVSNLAEIAAAALRAGAEAITLVNTVLGMAIDLGSRRPALGGGGGGLSGAAIHPVSVRAVYDCRAALPEATIIGVGGVSTGRDAIELILAGATAVQVGTATLADPRAAPKVLSGMRKWCEQEGVKTVSELIGAAHG